jgi:DNA-binding LacI/PurR family transcriptional regulator
MTHTIRDIARLSGFSTATVSRAFSAPQMVSETTRKRVQEVAETLDYNPMPSPVRWLSSGRRRSRF